LGFRSQLIQVGFKLPYRLGEPFDLSIEVWGWASEVGLQIHQLRQRSLSQADREKVLACRVQSPMPRSVMGIFEVLGGGLEIRPDLPEQPLSALDFQ